MVGVLERKHNRHHKAPTPPLHEGDQYGAFCEFRAWSMFYLGNCRISWGNRPCYNRIFFISKCLSLLHCVLSWTSSCSPLILQIVPKILLHPWMIYSTLLWKKESIIFLSLICVIPLKELITMNIFDYFQGLQTILYDDSPGYALVGAYFVCWVDWRNILFFTLATHSLK